MKQLVKLDHVDDSTERQQLEELCAEYHDIFALPKTDFGRTNYIRHRIDTQGAPAVRQQSRRIPPAVREQCMQSDASNERKWHHQTIKQSLGFPYCSCQKERCLRFCVDYRKLNEVTRKDAYPLPRIDETLEALGGAKHFTTLDLISGYWQVVVEPDDCSKTAFTTPFGLYEFTVMPFGLSNAPATFQRVMEQVLAGLPWQVCLVYLDDIIVYGQTLDEHRENLRKVFQCIREAGLKLQPSRCSFLQPEVLYLGHIVTADGIRTDPTKTAVVKDWRVPRNTKDVRQFLGLVSYYRRFVPGFATLAAPLHKVSTKTSLFTWDKHCQTAFEELRHRLTTTPVLTYPRFDSPFLVDTDASNHGLGAVLSQVENGKERVVVYASRVLSKAERNYCATRKELLAVVYAVEQFRPYLYGQQFLLRTDHGALQWLCNFKSPEGQLARWLEKLSEFQFRIQHRLTTHNPSCDLSSHDV